MIVTVRVANLGVWGVSPREVKASFGAEPPPPTMGPPKLPLRAENFSVLGGPKTWISQGKRSVNCNLQPLHF